jgi:hypothetical protein
MQVRPLKREGSLGQEFDVSQCAAAFEKNVGNGSKCEILGTSKCFPV